MVWVRHRPASSAHRDLLYYTHNSNDMMTVRNASSTCLSPAPSYYITPPRPGSSPSDWQFQCLP
jgi:hypothetical protein